MLEWGRSRPPRPKSRVAGVNAGVKDAIGVAMCFLILAPAAYAGAHGPGLHRAGLTPAQGSNQLLL